MKPFHSLILGFVVIFLAQLIPSISYAQCSGNPNTPGDGYIIQQALNDPVAAQFFDRGSSQHFQRTVTVTRLQDGYSINIVDTPKCNNGNFNDCYPFSFFTAIQLDCDFNVIGIAVS